MTITSDTTGPSGITYSIRFVTDLLGVPADRLADCLNELAAFVVLCRGLHAVMGDSVTPPDAFEWTDDGLGEVGFSLKDTATGEVVHGPVLSVKHLRGL
jgi:hypothetical protein